MEIETNCEALRDVLLSDKLNTMHACGGDGILAHQIIDVHHILGRILVRDRLSHQDEVSPHTEGDGSCWKVVPDLEEA